MKGHVHGKDYGDSAELQADFEVLRDALRRHGGVRAADGALAIAQQVLAASGLNLATLDVREHSEKHHEVLARLFDRVGELDRPYTELSRAERTTVLGRELGSRRPLVGSAITEDAVDPRATPPAPPTTCSGRSGTRIGSTAPPSSRPTSSR